MNLSIRYVFLGACLILASACGKPSAGEMIQQGVVLMNNRDLDGAELMFQRVLKEYPEAPEALQARLGLADCFNAKGQTDLAVDQLDRLIEYFGGIANNDGFGVFTNKLSILGQQGGTTRALQLALESSATLAQAPLRNRSHFNMMVGEMYLQLGEHQKARDLGYAMLAEAADATEFHPAAVDTVAKSFDPKTETSLLIAFFREYLARFPNSPLYPDIQFSLAEHLRISGNAEEAKEIYLRNDDLLTSQMQTALPERKSHLMLALGQMQLTRGDTVKGIETLEAVRKDFEGQPAAAQALLLLSTVDLGQNRRDDAIEKLTRAIAEAPNTRIAADAINQIQAIRQMPPAAGAAGSTTATLVGDAPSSPPRTADPATTSAATGR